MPAHLEMCWYLAGEDKTETLIQVHRLMVDLLHMKPCGLICLPAFLHKIGYDACPDSFAPIFRQKTYFKKMVLRLGTIDHQAADGAFFMKDDKVLGLGKTSRVMLALCGKLYLEKLIPFL